MSSLKLSSSDFSPCHPARPCSRSAGLHCPTGLMPGDVCARILEPWHPWD
jgi:hypothetical protein